MKKSIIAMALMIPSVFASSPEEEYFNKKVQKSIALLEGLIEFNQNVNKKNWEDPSLGQAINYDFLPNADVLKEKGVNIRLAPHTFGLINCLGIQHDIYSDIKKYRVFIDDGLKQSTFKLKSVKFNEVVLKIFNEVNIQIKNLNKPITEEADLKQRMVVKSTLQDIKILSCVLKKLNKVQFFNLDSSYKHSNYKLIDLNFRFINSFKKIHELIFEKYIKDLELKYKNYINKPELKKYKNILINKYENKINTKLFNGVGNYEFGKDFNNLNIDIDTLLKFADVSEEFESILTNPALLEDLIDQESKKNIEELTSKKANEFNNKMRLKLTKSEQRQLAKKNKLASTHAQKSNDLPITKKQAHANLVVPPPLKPILAEENKEKIEQSETKLKDMQLKDTKISSIKQESPKKILTPEKTVNKSDKQQIKQKRIEEQKRAKAYVESIYQQAKNNIQAIDAINSFESDFAWLNALKDPAKNITYQSIKNKLENLVVLKNGSGSRRHFTLEETPIGKPISCFFHEPHPDEPASIGGSKSLWWRPALVNAFTKAGYFQEKKDSNT